MSKDPSTTLLMIVCLPDREKTVTEMLSDSDGWTIIPKVWGHGPNRTFHQNRTGSGHLMAIYVVVRSELVPELSERLRKLRTTAPGGYTEPLHVFAWEAETLV